jgi:hypothetical protein
MANATPSVVAERRLILLAAGTAARRQAAATKAIELAAQLDWGRLAETLSRRRLLPTLGPRILALSGEQASAEFQVAVEAAIEAARRQAVLLQLAGAQVTTGLGAAGIRSAPLKGPFLAEAIHGDPGRRLASDVDLLVDPGQLDAAVAVARQLGYADASDHVEADGLPQLHFALLHERGELPPVELHWRIHWYERRFAAERLLPAAVDGSADWRPEPADELAALLLFYARDGFVDLRVATDVGAWWDARGGELEPGALAEVVRRYPAFARVLPAAAQAAERTVGLPASRLVAGPRHRLRGRLAVRLANPNPDDEEAQVFAEMGLIDGLLAPPGGLRPFFKRQLLPPPEVLAAHDRRAGGRRLRSALGYRARLLIRWGVIGRYLLAVRRLLRPGFI